MWNTY